MTTWVNDGFVGQLFTLTGSFMPAPPAGAQPATLWGVESHINDVFGAVGATPGIERQIVDFDFQSVEDAVGQYAESFGPIVSARATLEPSGRWEEFIAAFRDLVARCNSADDGTARLRSDYFVVLVQR